jgi:hypothetical protein
MHMLKPTAGQLFLSAFSGPVEGILIIVGIYAISGLKGNILCLLHCRVLNPKL